MEKKASKFFSLIWDQLTSAHFPAGWSGAVIVVDDCTVLVYTVESMFSWLAI